VLSSFRNSRHGASVELGDFDERRFAHEIENGGHGSFASNGIVLDPFAGSGTIFIAAEQTGRRARGIEIDPGYVDVAIKRWQRFTGKSALLAGTDQTFKEIEGQRAHSGPPEAKADQVVMPADREAA
jgi:DNA methylase